MTMERYIQDKEANDHQRRHQGVRDHDAWAWLQNDIPPEERLSKFDFWLRRQLDLRIDWAWAGSAKEKRLEQCRLQIDGLILDLWRRGWMLDGPKLAVRIIEMLRCIETAQDHGKVRDFWPYFKATVNRYVGLNAEEIQAEAMSMGMTAGQVFQAIAKRLPGSCTIPELIVQRAQETLREKLSRKRRADGLKAAQKDQLPLL